MSNIVHDHIERVRTAVLKRDTAATIARWITENTFLGGKNYSFVDHEFQEKILSDISKEVNVKKPSQVGMSEASARMALALTNVIRPYTVIYTLQTASYAGTFAKTRLDPIVQTSKTMKGNVHRTNDNNEIKQFGDSFLYIKGAASANAPISIPADHLIHDEVDFSDQEVLSQYFSRLTHSKWKRISRFSTPTLPKYGISRAFDSSRQFYNLCKCNHCNHTFIPDYYQNVKVPGYKGDLIEINAAKLTKIRWHEAYLSCPSCLKEPSLQIEHREWVCKNPNQNFVAAGYQVTPFDAPNVITIPSLVEASTKYERIQDFVNFNLGLDAEDTEATLTQQDFQDRFVNASDEYGASVNVMGVDVGNVYHMVVGAVNNKGQMRVIHSEAVPLGEARKRYMELRLKYRAICTVIDSQPHAETVMALQTQDANLYAAVYTGKKGLNTHTVIDKETDDDKGKTFVRQVNINRNRAFDAYMEFIRAGNLEVVRSENDQTFIAHHMSMKRAKLFDPESHEMSYSWQKTDGQDHFHHAMIYLWVASRIRGVGKSTIAMPLFGVFPFKQKFLV